VRTDDCCVWDGVFAAILLAKSPCLPSAVCLQNPPDCGQLGKACCIVSTPSSELSNLKGEGGRQGHGQSGSRGGGGVQEQGWGWLSGQEQDRLASKPA